MVADNFSKPRDIVKDLRSRWIRLEPGYYYGRTTELLFPPKGVGKFELVGREVSTKLKSEEAAAVQSHEYMVITGTYESKPVYIQIVK